MFLFHGSKLITFCVMRIFVDPCVLSRIGLGSQVYKVSEPGKPGFRGLSLGHMSGVSALSVYSIKQSKTIDANSTYVGGRGGLLHMHEVHPRTIYRSATALRAMSHGTLTLEG